MAVTITKTRVLQRPWRRWSVPQLRRCRLAGLAAWPGVCRANLSPLWAASQSAEEAMTGPIFSAEGRGPEPVRRPGTRGSGQAAQPTLFRRSTVAMATVRLQQPVCPAPGRGRLWPGRPRGRHSKQMSAFDTVMMGAY